MDENKAVTEENAEELAEKLEEAVQDYAGYFKGMSHLGD